MHKQLLTTIASATLCLFLCLTTSASADRTVRAGIYNFKPLVYSTADGTPTGLYVDILNHVAQKQNWNIIYQHGTWQENLERLKNNQIDLLVCIGYTPERAKFLDFPEEYLLLDWGLVYTAKNVEIRTIMDLEGKTVTALKGSIYTAGFKELLSQFNIRVNLIEVDQIDEILASLKNGTADAGITSNTTGILNKSAQSIERSSIIFTPVRIGYAVNGGKNQDLLAALDQHIAELKADKSSIYYSSLEKMFSKAPQRLPTYLYISIALVIGLLAIALLFIAALRHQVRAKTKTIEESEKRLRDITDNAPCVIFMKDLEGRYLHVNRLYEELFHLNREAVIGKTDFDLFPPDHARAFRDNDLLVQQSTTPLTIEEQVPQQDGMHSYLSVKFPLHDSSGTTYAICGIASDITERANIEKELQETRDLLLNIINTSTDFIFVKDQQLRTMICNTAFAAALDKKPEELQGKTDIENGWALELVKGDSEEGISGYEHDDLQVLAGETIHISDLATVQGESRYFDTIKTPLKDTSGKIFGLLGISRDVTESKRTQLALQKHLIALTCPLDNAEELSFSDLFNIDDLQEIQDRFAEATGVASLITTPDGTPITKPSNFCRLCSEIIRKTEKGLANCRKSDTTIGRHHPEGPIIQPCLSGGLWDAGASITLGGKHFANWLIGQVRNEAQHEDEMLAYADHIGANREQFKAALAEVPVMSREQFEKIAQALHTLANELSLKAYQNIQQARFIAERTKFEAELQAKNSELESFAYTASHDLKSPLITIQSYAGMIMLDLQSGNYPRATQDLERISNVAVKMAHLLDNLLQLSRVGRHVKAYEQLNLNHLLNGVLAQLAGSMADKNILVTVQPDLPTVSGDRIRLEELLQNLLENAIKYLGDQPSPCIEIGCRKNGTEQVLFIRDNGIGIAPQYHETIFGLFNRLDTDTPGTGIGLALAKKVVETHGGKIWVESEGPGAGSCFCFTLPSFPAMKPNTINNPQKELP